MTSRATTLASAVAALLASAWTYLKMDDPDADSMAIMFLTIGLILTGAWLTLEIHAVWHASKPQEEEDDGQSRPR